jgi:hypothetical protein
MTPKPPSPLDPLIASGNHPVTHRVLLLGAYEYGRAAVILARSPYLPMVPFAEIVCHSIELGLKAYLLFSGANEQSLKDIGHDLERAWRECSDKGLQVQFPPFWLTGLNMQHANPFIYRYWRQGLGWSMPGTQEMMVNTLSDALRQIGAAVGDQGTNRLEQMI